MAIDRIGKGGGPPSLPETPDTKATAKTDKVFHVEKPERSAPVDATTATTGPAAAAATTATSPLARLRAGEIDVNGYVDAKVHEATAHLPGLSTSDLGALRKMLREQMASDPGLAELVRAATGRVPEPPED
jgi:hypothetical protein